MGKVICALANSSHSIHQKARVSLANTVAGGDKDFNLQTLTECAVKGNTCVWCFGIESVGFLERKMHGDARHVAAVNSMGTTPQIKELCVGKHCSRTCRPDVCRCCWMTVGMCLPLLFCLCLCAGSKVCSCAPDRKDYHSSPMKQKSREHFRLAVTLHTGTDGWSRGYTVAEVTGMCGFSVGLDETVPLLNRWCR